MACSRLDGRGRRSGAWAGGQLRDLRRALGGHDELEVDLRHRPPAPRGRPAWAARTPSSSPPFQRRDRAVRRASARRASMRLDHGLACAWRSARRRGCLRCSRASTPFRLASESIRNCADTTTRWPGLQAAPDLGLAADLDAGLDVDRAEAPVVLGDASPPCAVPVWITASVGTSSALRAARVAASPSARTCPAPAGRPGWPVRTRALSVRVARIDLGQQRLHRAARTSSPGSAGLLRLHRRPARTSAAWLSGTSALAQTRGQAVDAEQRRAGHHGHALAHHQFGDHAADRRRRA